MLDADSEVDVEALLESATDSFFPEFSEAVPDAGKRLDADGWRNNQRVKKTLAAGLARIWSRDKP
ncbi:MAG: hypothetical protein LC750_00300, partial [Actinobacteria bacterium]|nr:hypothetical protein [Actinomycetota bacterium]